MTTNVVGGAGFDGSVAVVVGGASGIGQAVAERLHALGSMVWIFDTNPAGMRWIKTDVSDDAAMASAFETVALETDRIDFLVNTAAIGAVGTVEDDPMDHWAHVLDVNVLGPARAIRGALPLLRRSAHPSVVTLSSAVAEVGLPQRALYTASNGAVAALIRACAADFMAEGIRFNAINPGTVDTPWVQRLLEREPDPEGMLAQLRSRQPHGRLVDASEVVEGVLLLLSPHATSINATTLTIDGGLTSTRVPPASSRTTTSKAAAHA